MKDSTHLYRFALFGRSDAGKTCILTAMSLNHKSNPLGHGVVWVPDPPEADTADADVAEAYKEGKLALDRARAAMRRGEKPPPSPLRILRYRFDFTTVKPQPRAYKVELTDYSGELLDPRMNAEGLARKLRLLLGNMDGVFVLAEAPRPGAERNRLPEEFELLQQAFAVLAAEKEKRKVAAATPVVLMLNKWDRRHPAPATPAQRAAEMDEFLHGDPEPPHLALTRYLEGAVAEGCYHAVPVSAFGTARTETQTDQDGVSRQVELPPTEFPLPSFGLEDGFVWAARTRDEQDVAAFERTSAGLSVAKLIPWFGLNALNPFAAMDVRRAGNELAARFPASSDQHKRARDGAGKAVRVAALRSLTLTVFLLTLLLGGEAALDVARFRRAEADFARTDLDFPDLERHQQFLLAYSTSPAYRHFGSRLLVGRDEAKDLHRKMYDRHERLLCDKMDALDGDVFAQEPFAVRYEDLFPSGTRAPKAAEIRQKAETKRCVAANQKHLDDARAAADGLAARLAGPTGPTAGDVTALDRQVSAVPHAEHLTDRQKAALADLREKAAGLGEAVAARDGEKGVTDAVKRGDFADAGKLLRRMRDGNVKADLPKLTADAVAEARRLADAALAGENWRTAVDVADKAKDGLGDLLTVEQADAVADWADRARKGQHRDLYAEVRRSPTEAACRRYLTDETVPNKYKKRTAQVQAMLEYHRQMASPRSLTFTVKELTISRVDYFDRGFGLYAYVNDNAVCVSTGNSTGWDNGKTVSIDRGGKATATPTGTVRLKIQFGNYTSYEELGALNETVPVSKLEGGRITLGLGKYSYNNQPSSVTFAVSGLPPKPDLPNTAD